MRGLYALLCAALISTTAFAAPFADPSKKVGTLGIDMDFYLRPEQVRSNWNTFATVPAAEELEVIIRVGARALDWLDLLQKDIPENQREQVWRKADRVGHEASPDSPMHYNPAIISEWYSKAMAEAPKAITDILNADTALPTTPPQGSTLHDVAEVIRAINTACSRGSRWLALSVCKYYLEKTTHDLRPWLNLKNQAQALESATDHWEEMSVEARTAFLNQLAEACPIAFSVAKSTCISNHENWIRAAQVGKDVKELLQDLIQKGQNAYDEKFGVRIAHEGVKTSVENGFHLIEVPTYGIDNDTLSWIQDRTKEAWTYKDSVGITLSQNETYKSGAMKVEWQKGALPHVNGIAGDTITMDANTPKWLELSVITMRHELGHVFGFADCYVEFWDDEKEAFTYYVLDPNDAMCALSGSYLDRHREALLKGYFPNP